MRETAWPVQSSALLEDSMAKCVVFRGYPSRSSSREVRISWYPILSVVYSSRVMLPFFWVMTPVFIRVRRRLQVDIKGGHLLER